MVKVVIISVIATLLVTVTGLYFIGTMVGV